MQKGYDARHVRKRLPSEYGKYIANVHSTAREVLLLNPREAWKANAKHLQRPYPELPHKEMEYSNIFIGISKARFYPLVDYYCFFNQYQALEF